MTFTQKSWDTLLEHYQASYKPKAKECRLTLSDVRFDISPIFLSLISPVFRDIPTPEPGIFNMDRLQYLKTVKDFSLFVHMCGVDYDDLVIKNEKLEDAKWVSDSKDSFLKTHFPHSFKLEHFLAAGRLCDFLGIEPVSTIRRMQIEYHDMTTENYANCLELVMYHEASLLTNNHRATMDLYQILARTFDEENSIIFLDDNDEEEEIEHNLQMHHVHRLYYEFWQHLFYCEPEEEIDINFTFLKEKLGWKEGGNVRYGYRLFLT